MRIIISPAKRMRVDTDSFVCTELPVFTDRAEILMQRKGFNQKDVEYWEQKGWTKNKRPWK